MLYEVSSFECSRIAQDLQIRKVQVESVVQLFNEGNTVPFITRYRKERTGGLDEDVLRQVQSRLNFVKQLHERKQTILKSIENQGKLTDELRREILNAPTVRRLEDLYMPFKPRKKNLALAAREKGLEPLALALWHRDPAINNLEELLPTLVDPEKQLNTVVDVQTGVQHLLAEMINETAEVRAQVRRVLWKTAVLTAAKNEKVPEGQGNEYKPYFQFKEPVQEIRPHRILALNRGEKDGVLKVKLEWPADVVQKAALTALAERLEKIAGTPVPPSAPVPTKAPTPTPGEPPSAPGPDWPAPPTAPPEPAPTPPDQTPAPLPEPPGAPPESPPSPFPPALPPEAPPESPPAPGIPETPPGAPPGSPPASPPELPPSSPPVGTPPAPHAESLAAPLVETLPAPNRPPMTGDPLIEGSEFRSPHAAFLRQCMDDALQRLLLPSLEREIRSELTDEAEIHAVKVFAHNIRSLLMQPPLVGRRVLAIDPGFRTGCKLAALDEWGNLLEHGVIYPHGGAPGEGKKRKEKEKKPAAPPATPAPADAAAGSATAPPSDPPGTSMEAPVPTQEIAAATTPIAEMAPVVESAAPPAPEAAPTTESPAPAPEPAAPKPDHRAEAKARIVELVQKHNLNVVAIGNGTACRETEEVVAEVIASSLPELSYVIVSEAGASVYSVSPLAKEEFPTLDATQRSASSIGRRLQDPLSELVKIDPQSLGVGLYQHDMGRKELKEALEGVVESCVNQVGVDLNTASVPLLRYVSGLNQMVAREIVERRKNQGPFTNRDELLQVSGMGPARYTQAAGFLKIPSAANPLDRTWVHPESYGVAEKLIAELGFTPSVLEDKEKHPEFRAKLNQVNLEEMARKLEIGVVTLDGIMHALAKPGRDPRQDLPPPIFKKGILKLEDLQPGQELKGTVLNVVDFGAFVDVGLKESGLVHISQMANKYIKSPYDVVSVNDIVTVWVLKIDKDTNHVSLTMIQPGSERKPQERGAPRPPRREGDAPAGEHGRPPRREGPPREQREHRPGGPPRDQRSGGRPQRRGGPPRHGAPREEQPAPSPPPPPPPPRKPRREAPKPKLTQAAIEGKAPLRTLGELAAFFAAKEAKDKPPEPKAEEKKETPPPEPPPAPPEAAPGETPPS